MVVILPRDFEAQYNKLIFSSNIQYRNSRTGARSTRTQIDHDVFEGLPVRHWRKKSFNVNAAPEKDNLNPLGTGDTGWPELPMPRDAHLYSPMSEALLRAARMAQVKKPAAPLLDDEKEPGDDEDADGDLDVGFVAKRWAVVPKDMEGPEPEFLAKRRKGLPSVYTGATGPLGNTTRMRKTKIRKMDTEGNSYIWEVLVPEGQAVDGEVVEEETSPTQVPAPGTVVEGLGVVNAEGVVIAGDQAMPTANRRRPPPPKRKAKGPGRGRKKKVAFISGTDGTATSDGVNALLNGSAAGQDDGKSAKMEYGGPDGDTEMGDGNVLPEGEEGSEEGSEGEEGEDGDREEGELSPSPTPAKSPAEPPTIVVNDMKLEPAELAYGAALPPSNIPLSLPAEPIHEDSSDPMLLDEDDDEPISRSPSEPKVTSIAQSTEFITDFAAPVAAEVSEETMPTPESISRPSEAVVEEHHAASIVEPQTKAQTELMTTPPPDTTLQPLPEPGDLSVTDKITAEQPTESLAESLTRPGAEPTSDILTEQMTEGTAASTVEAVAEETPSAPTDLTEEAMPEPNPDNLEVVMIESVPTSSIDAAPGPTTNTISTPRTEAMVELNGESELELLSEPPTESVPESIGEFEPVNVQSMAGLPLAEQTLTEQLLEQSMAEQPSAEHTMDEQPMAEQLIAEQHINEQHITEQPPTLQPVTEQSVTERPTTKKRITEQSITEQPITERPMTEQAKTEQAKTEQAKTEQAKTEQAMAEHAMTEQAMTEHAMAEHATAEQAMTEQAMTEQAMTEPWGRPATEAFPEAISPERRFSYTRVTTSPQAPTPSPPTPIESTFGLKAPFLSPKAPTMSPPTPIERSMSSSPDIALADQHFRLPPQIDAAQEADQAPAPDMPHILGADRISVEAAPNPNVDSQIKAEIPAAHNPLNGMTEPRVAEDSEGSTQHFTDGEEDLLGSLERSLG